MGCFIIYHHIMFSIKLCKNWVFNGVNFYVEFYFWLLPRTGYSAIAKSRRRSNIHHTLKAPDMINIFDFLLPTLFSASDQKMFYFAEYKQGKGSITNSHSIITTFFMLENCHACKMNQEFSIGCCHQFRLPTTSQHHFSCNSAKYIQTAN